MAGFDDREMAVDWRELHHFETNPDVKKWELSGLYHKSNGGFLSHGGTPESSKSWMTMN